MGELLSQRALRIASSIDLSIFVARLAMTKYFRFCAQNLDKELSKKSLKQVFATFCFYKKKNPLNLTDSNQPSEANSQNLTLDSANLCYNSAFNFYQRMLMLFSSFTFIFIFLPLVWVVFHALKRAHFRHHYAFAKIFLIISSLFFYAFWKVAYLPILLGSIVINYFLAKMILRKIAIGGGDYH